VINRDTGEITLTTKAGVIYRLILNTTAMVALEDHYSTPAREATFEEAWAKATGGTIRGLRTLMWAMAQTHHPGLSLEDANAIIDGAGGLDGLQRLIAASQEQLTPDPKDAKSLKTEQSANPRAAGRRGRGATSTRQPAGPA